MKKVLHEITEKIKNKTAQKTVYLNHILIVMGIVVIIRDWKVYLVNFRLDREKKGGIP